MSRLVWGAALLVAVLVLVALNLRGSAPSVRVNAVENPELEREVRLLRERVKMLEAKFAARVAVPAAPVASGNDAVVVRTQSAASGNVAPTAAATKTGMALSVETLSPAGGAGAAAPTLSSSAKAMVVATDPATGERKAAPRAEGHVGSASYWSDLEVSTPAGWCRKPPPYAAKKPEFVKVSTGSDLPELTAELAKRHASKDNMLIATYVNYNRLDFAFTFVKHLRALNNPHFIVGALDEKALRGLQEYSVPTFIINSGLTTNDYGWGTYAFRQLGLHKVQLVLNLAKTGVDCLTVDADAFILRDPFPYIRRMPEAEVLMSSDHLVATNGYQDDGLESPSGFGSAFNIGYIWIKASALEFVQAWRDACYRDPNAWDQVLFAAVLRRGGGGSGGFTDHRLQKMFKKSDGSRILGGVLPVSLFASGHTFFVSRMAHLMHDHPYMVHTTFQYGGAQGKRHRLREAMMWEDPEDYYSGNFLTYEPDLPYNLVYPNGGTVGADGTQEYRKHMNVEQHFQLVHHQLAQMRNAFALAQKTGRILILPQLVCGLDRWWAPHGGIIPGSAARLPLLECPADHVIDLERIGKPERILREANMLCNPRTPASVLQSVKSVDVALMHDGKPVTVSPDGSDAAAARDLGLAKVQLLRDSFSDAKVLKLKGLAPDYRTILTEGEIVRFENEYKSYASLWCCNRPPGGRGAGHIWYDFFADVIPHKDRFSRQWTSTWTPKMGP